MNISNRSATLQFTAIRKLVPFALKAKADGVKVYPLNIGDPDLKTPDAMINKLHNWDINPIRYCNSLGEADFITSLQTYYKKYGFDFLKPENIQVAVGASEALAMAYFAVCEVGDEVIVFEPFFGNYANVAQIMGVKLVPVSTKIEDGFHLPNEEDIKAKISSKTKAILYCSPNNPTGTMLRKDEIDTLVKIAVDNDLFLISDEVYREFNFTDEKHTSLLEYMEKYPKNMIMTDSLSKRYSMCGARLGMLVTLNPEVSAAVLKYGQSRLSAGLVDQLMGAELVNVPESYTTDLRNEYKARRDLVYSKLKEMPGVTVSLPEGAFYMIVSLPIEDSEKFCMWLLSEFRDNNETIFMAPAPGFYATLGRGKNEVRIAYVIKQEDLARSMEILKAALIKYNT